MRDGDDRDDVVEHYVGHRKRKALKREVAGANSAGAREGKKRPSVWAERDQVQRSVDLRDEVLASVSFIECGACGPGTCVAWRGYVHGPRTRAQS